MALTAANSGINPRAPGSQEQQKSRATMQRRTGKVISECPHVLIRGSRSGHAQIALFCARQVLAIPPRSAIHDAGYARLDTVIVTVLAAYSCEIADDKRHPVAASRTAADSKRSEDHEYLVSIILWAKPQRLGPAPSYRPAERGGHSSRWIGVDVVETSPLGTARALVTPPGRQILINGPDRMLLFVVDHHAVKLAIFSVEHALTTS